MIVEEFKSAPKSALCVAAHPDDLEFGVSGSVAKWVSQGAKVYYLILTNGDKGSDDKSLSPKQLKDTRRKEQQAAAEILGVRQVFFCDYEDGGLEPNMTVKKDIVRIIRQTKPELVYCIDPTVIYSLSGFGVNHPDHRAAGQATLDAIYPLARDHLSFPDLYKNEKLEPHKVNTILMTNFEKQNCYVDISGFIDKKLEALGAHTSQLPDEKVILSGVKQRASETGKVYGSNYAEAFIKLDIAF